MSSEQLRVRVLVTVLAVLLIANQALFLFGPEFVRQFARRPPPVWLPFAAIGPFVLYETVVLLVLRHRGARGLGMPTPLRFVNATVETSLPTVILWLAAKHAEPVTVFGAWPSLLYFVFIVAATLRLDLALPAFTGAVAALSYLGLAWAVLPIDASATELPLKPIYHLTKAAIMVVAGVVAGLVAMRLRHKFNLAAEAAAARERVTNLFGQHVSPSVVDRLLSSPPDFAGEIRQVCVMFLDIRNFTANARTRSPDDVVTFLNEAFAFMIDAVDRHGGFINKFLGDGFMAIFGAPLDDPAACRNAVAAAREILAEIDRRGLADRPWPLKVGIGLHAGPAVTGNIGSPRRKEFTAVGDTVNLAARLEQLTREREAQLLVSDAVMSKLAADAGQAVALGEVPIKGYAGPVRVWRLA